MSRKFLFAIPFLLSVRLASAQVDAAQPAESPAAGSKQETPQSSTLPSDYVIGPFDQITVTVGELKEEVGDKPFRVDANGDFTLPLAGRIHAGGLTPEALQDQIKQRLSNILKNPDVVVGVEDFATHNVSILGAVTTPGVQKFVGQKTIFEMLSSSQGLAPTAGTTVRITRQLRWGVLPLAGVTVDTANQTSTATVRMKDISRAGQENITVMPGDAIFVPRADLVYVVGSVAEPGGFPIGENEKLSALQVVSLAKGLVKTAAASKAKILRVVPGNPSRIEIPVNIKLLMAGKTNDVPLRPDDILFVPNSGAKSAGYRTIDAIVGATSAMIVYGSRL